MVDNYGFLSGKKVLVTGGSGFIGSHLVKRLVLEGADVHICGRGKAGNWRLRAVGVEEFIHFHSINITDSQGVDRLIGDIMPDYVFHLAAYGVDSRDRDYIEAVNTNVIGIVNLLDALRKYGCRKLINLGSCAEYGDIREPMHEEMFPHPVSIYGSTKASATIIAHQIALENHIDIVTLRPFGLFGEGEERHKLFCYVITNLLKDREVKLMSCTQERDYLYVGNLVDAMILAAENEAVRNEVINIGSGDSYPLKHYVEMIFNALGSSKKPLYGSLESRANEMWSPKPDLSKIRNMLGWKPRISIEEGILRTVEWYKKNLHLYE